MARRGAADLRRAPLADGVFIGRCLIRSGGFGGCGPDDGVPGSAAQGCPVPWGRATAAGQRSPPSRTSATGTRRTGRMTDLSFDLTLRDHAAIFLRPSITVSPPVVFSAITGAARPSIISMATTAVFLQPRGPFELTGD
jgi:hypothetical protein